MRLVFGSTEALAVLAADRVLQTAVDTDEDVTKIYRVIGSACIASPDGDENYDRHVFVDEVVHCEHIQDAVGEALLQMGCKRGCDEWNGNIIRLDE